MNEGYRLKTKNHCLHEAPCIIGLNSMLNNHGFPRRTASFNPAAAEHVVIHHVQASEVTKLLQLVIILAVDL